MSFADLVARVAAGEFGYTAQYRKKILGSLRKADRIALFDHAPLSRISISLADFDRRAGKGPIRHLPPDFKSNEQFKRWRKEVRGVLQRALGSPRAPIRPAWLDLIERAAPALSAKPSNEDFIRVRLTVLARAASDKGVEPLDLTQDLFETMLRDCVSSGERKSLRRAAADLATFAQIDAASDVPLLSLPQPLTSRRSAPVLPAVLKAEIDAFIDMRRFKTFRGVRRHLAGISEETANHNRNGINWLVSCAVTLGLVDLDETTSIASLSREEIVANAVIAEMDGDFPWSELSPSSLKGYLKSACQFLVPHNSDIAKVRNDLLALDYFIGAGGMSPRRQAWCQRLVTTSELERRFLSLPNTLYGEARELWGSFDRLTSMQQNRVLMLCTVTAAAAELLSLPLRAQTLLDQRSEGKEPHIVFPANSSGLLVSIPAHLTKNKRPIGPVSLIPKPGGNPREIATWFRDGPREMLLQRLADKGKADHEKFFCGLKYGRLYEWWGPIVAKSGIAHTLHMVRHGLSSILINKDPTNVVLVAAILCDTVGTVLKHYAWLDVAKRLEHAQKEAVSIGVGNALRGRQL